MLPVSDTSPFTSENILTLGRAAEIIAQLKAQGRKVGLCHGGFDLTHPGHVKHFESAKRFCDALFVSVTADGFVNSRKGSGRPVYTAQLRAYMAASIRPVDFVVVSPFKSGVEVISLLKPSLYIKGPDFIGKETPGITAEREAIRNVGGEICYTADPSLSTTSIIGYIKEVLDMPTLLLCIDRDGTLVRNDDFLGRNPRWTEEIVYNEDLVSFLVFLQTKYRTTKVVVSNQAGVARRLFSCACVEEVNAHIGRALVSKGVCIDSWQYCPEVDTRYASAHPELGIDPTYVREETARKPSPRMVFDALELLGARIGDFTTVLVLGDREEDRRLAENLGALFLDVKGLGYEGLLEKWAALERGLA